MVFDRRDIEQDLSFRSNDFIIFFLGNTCNVMKELVTNGLSYKGHYVKR